MIFADEERLLGACAACMGSRDTGPEYDYLINGCRTIGRSFIRIYNIVPPMLERMVYLPYSGSGSINFNKTIVECCGKGKTLESVTSRVRVRDIKKVRMAILYDDSSSSLLHSEDKTGQANEIDCKSPQAYSKVACISMMEGLSKDMDISLWQFSDKVKGPLKTGNGSYREFLLDRHSSGKRLDMALEALVATRWHKRPGAKIALVMTDGIPEMGRGSYDEDLLVNIKTMNYIRELLKSKCKVLYLYVQTDEKTRFRRSGGFTAKELLHELAKIGCTTMYVDTASNVGDSLFEGLRRAIENI